MNEKARRRVDYVDRDDGHPREVIHARVREDLRQRIKALAKRRGVTMAVVLEELIETGLR